MSHQAQTHVLNNSRQKGSHLLVLLIIANHAHGDGTNAYPSATTLAFESRLSPRQVKRIIADLEASGELFVNRSTGHHVHNMSINMGIINERQRPRQDRKPAADNSDKMSPSHRRPTVTNPSSNGDKSDASTASTVTNSHANGDIAVSPKHKEQNLRTEPEGKESTHAPPVDPLDLKCPVEMFKAFFSVDVGNNMRMAILGSVKDLPAWRRLLTLKAAFADKPEKERGKIQHWILGAYEEFLEKENGRNGNRKHDASGGIGEAEGAESSEDALRRIGSNPEF
jgi:hypothetical protein